MSEIRPIHQPTTGAETAATAEASTVVDRQGSGAVIHFAAEDACVVGPPEHSTDWAEDTKLARPGDRHTDDANRSVVLSGAVDSDDRFSMGVFGHHF